TTHDTARWELAGRIDRRAFEAFIGAESALAARIALGSVEVNISVASAHAEAALDVTSITPVRPGLPTSPWSFTLLNASALVHDQIAVLFGLATIRVILESAAADRSIQRETGATSSSLTCALSEGHAALVGVRNHAYIFAVAGHQRVRIWSDLAEAPDRSRAERWPTQTRGGLCWGDPGKSSIAKAKEILMIIDCIVLCCGYNDCMVAVDAVSCGVGAKPQKSPKREGKEKEGEKRKEKEGEEKGRDREARSATNQSFMALSTPGDHGNNQQCAERSRCRVVRYNRAMSRAGTPTALQNGYSIPRPRSFESLIAESIGLNQILIQLSFFSVSVRSQSPDDLDRATPLQFVPFEFVVEVLNSSRLAFIRGLGLGSFLFMLARIWLPAPRPLRAPIRRLSGGQLIFPSKIRRPVNCRVSTYDHTKMLIVAFTSLASPSS
ncbi:hypothetical protein THAOC_27238, partial [Thalassiosira oceanica]